MWNINANLSLLGAEAWLDKGSKNVGQNFLASSIFTMATQPSYVYHYQGNTNWARY